MKSWRDAHLVRQYKVFRANPRHAVIHKFLEALGAMRRQQRPFKLIQAASALGNHVGAVCGWPILAVYDHKTLDAQCVLAQLAPVPVCMP